MRIIVAGTGLFAEPIFKSILNPICLITQPSQGIINKRASTRQSGEGIKTLAEIANVVVFQPGNINSQESIEYINSLKADLIVVAAYGQIFSKEFLANVKSNIVNVHASLLPKYRGAAPIAHAILNGEKVTGITVIKIDAGVDSGDILEQIEMPISAEDTTGSLELKLSELAAKFLPKIIHDYDFRNLVKQNSQEVTKAPKIKKEDGIINWGRTAEYICRHVRAMQPWPTAYTNLYGLKNTIRLAINEVSPTEIISKGKIGNIEIHDNRMFVVTLDKLVEIKTLHPACKRLMSVEEFLRGLHKKDQLFVGS